MKRNLLILLLLVPVMLWAQENLNKAVPDGRVDSVYQGINLPQSFTGEDVIIGIGDWGFDFTHPVFYDLQMQNYRILRFWDQYRTAGPAPEGFDYGSEIIGQEALLEAKTDTFNVYEYGYHGTHVASIAAGAGAGTAYRGVAPGSNLILCTFLTKEENIIDALRWMYNVAQEEQKRLVVNMSWGLYYMGFMDGTGPIAETIQELSEQGVVFVASAGNNGDVKFHVHKDFSTNHETLKTKINFATGGGASAYGQSITMESSPNTSFKYAIAVLDKNNGQVYGTTPFFDTQDGDYTIDTIMDVVGFPVEFIIDNVESSPQNHRPHARLRLHSTAFPIDFGLYVQADEGDFHAWNLIEMTNGVGNWGAPFSSAGEGWTAGDKQYGISLPGNVDCAITAASHIARTKAGSQFTGDGSISGYSSWGPLIDGTEKPDVSAPGQNVTAALSSYTNSTDVTGFNSINFQGRTYQFATLSGTSMSAPFVSGVAALILEANPYLSPAQVKDIMKQTAYQDEFTDALHTYSPGAGKVDAYQAVMMALNYTGVEQHSVSETRCRVYPNPVTTTAYVVLESDAYQFEASLYDMSGKQIASQYMNQGVNQVDMRQYSAGCYFLRVSDGQKVFTKKLVKM